jgi:hypothetical protein
MSRTAVRLVLKRMADAHLLPVARGFGAAAASPNPAAGQPAGHDARRDLVIITGQGRGSRDGRPVIQPALLVEARHCARAHTLLS